MYDRKIEPIAQKVVRARIIRDEAVAALEAACDEFKALVPEGQKYVTKDGETVTHAAGSIRRTPVVEALQGFLKGHRLRIWKAVRIDAVDVKKLNGFVAAGELNMDELVEKGCMEIIQVKSSIRVNFPSTRAIAS